MFVENEHDQPKTTQANTATAPLLGAGTQNPLLDPPSDDKRSNIYLDEPYSDTLPNDQNRIKPRRDVEQANGGYQRKRRAPLIDEDRPPTALEELAHHHILVKNKVTTGDLIVAGISTTVAGLSLILYIKPTHDLANGNIGLEIPLQGSTCGANFLVAVLATSESINSFRQHLPDELAAKIHNGHPPGKTVMIFRIAGIGLVAAVASLPFAAATQEPLPLKILVGIVYSIINFYSVNNIILEHGKGVVNFLRRSPQNKAYREVIAAFTHAMDTIRYEKATSTENFPKELSFESNLKLNQTMRFFARQSREVGVQPYKPENFIAWALQYLRVFPGAVGSVLVVAGLVGYESELYRHLGNQLGKNDQVNIPATIALSAPFLYLSAAFGAQAMMDMFDVITCNNRPSIASHLYKHQTRAATVFLITACLASFGTAVQLINKSPYFNDGGPLSESKDYFIGLAAAAAVISNAYASVKLGHKIIATCASLWGSEDKRKRANFDRNMQNFIKDVHSMSPEVFIDSMEQLSPEDQLALIPLLGFTKSVPELLAKAAGREDPQVQVNLSRLRFTPSRVRAINAGYQNADTREALERYEELPFDERVANNRPDEPPSKWEQFVDLLPACPQINLFGWGRRPAGFNLPEDLPEDPAERDHLVP